MEYKFLVIKTIGNFGPNIIREFSDEALAKQFVTCLRESEEHDFIKYEIAQVTDF